MVSGNDEVGGALHRASQNQIIGRIIGNGLNGQLTGRQDGYLEGLGYALYHLSWGGFALLEQLLDPWIGYYPLNFFNELRRDNKPDLSLESKFK